jgi:uncharacterized membrane protein
MANPLRTGASLTTRRLTVYGGLTALCGALALILLWTTGATPLDALGRPIGTDFAGIWTAGRMLVEGRAEAAFHPETLFAVQRDTFGSSGSDVYGWYYPPFFLAIAGALALMPYLPALLVWQAASFGLVVAALARIGSLQGRAWILVLGFPAVFVNLGHGQNGFLTAGLLAMGLVLLKRRPILAGVCLGLIAYKPQFALALPVLLVAGGHVRALFAAAATIAGMGVAATLWLERFVTLLNRIGIPIRAEV